MSETSWKRQVSPEVVEVPGSCAGCRVVAFSAEYPNITLRVWLPKSGASACTNHVVHEGYTGDAYICALLIDSAGAFPPDPLSEGMVIFPNVVEESGALRRTGAVSPAAEKEEVAVWVNPAHRTPPRSWDIPGSRSGLCSVGPGLIGDAGCAAAGHPNPLLCRGIKFPKIVENRSFGRVSSRRIEAESAEKPNVTESIGPEDPMLSAARSGSPRACAQRSVTAVLINGIGSGRPHPRPLL